MDFKDLSYVIAIAKTQNITKAADMLYVTQPTLTKFLQNLEREMGQKLFKKLGNRFVLTYAGERYVAKATEILNLKKELDNLNKQKENLHDLLERGIYDVDTFIERSNNIGTRIDSINDTLDSTMNIIENERTKEQAKYNIIPTLENVLEQYYNTDDILLKNKLLKSVLDKVVYTKDHKRRDEYDFDIVLYPKLPH